jgi:tRNA-dihydrouridine synthase B
VIKIGNIELDVPFFQASLAGYSDRVMRDLARKFGAPLTFAGVIIDTSAAHPIIIKKPAFNTAKDVHPIGGQIVGTDPVKMVKGAKSLVNAGHDIIDLNFACPARKVLRRGRGGTMLKHPDRVIEIYRRVREAVTQPVTMKLRIGYDESEESKEGFWQIVETAAADGIAAMIIHGRTVAQYYRGKADWTVVAEVKRRFPQITIIGSGDIFTPEIIVERLKSGIDGVTVARGAIGNPWIFSQTRALLAGKEKPPEPDIEEQREIMAKHFEDVLELHGKQKGVGYFRKFSARYSRLHPNRKAVHAEMLVATDADAVRAIIKNWYGATQSEQ